MSAALLVFPLENVVCPFCMSKFDRRSNEPDRRTCPACAESLRLFHEQSENCRKILEESLRQAGSDNPSAAIKRHLDDLLECRL